MDKTREMCGEREERDELEGGEDESFVVLMLNELENTIELLWLWKSLWGHRKLAPVWELACWQKRGFCVVKASSQACSHWDPRSGVKARSVTTSRHDKSFGGSSWTWMWELVLPAHSPPSYLLNAAYRSADLRVYICIYFFTMSRYLRIIIP